MQNKEIYVGNLSWSATEEDLSSFFNHYGEIETIKLIRDRESGKSRGFAFIRFISHDGAKNALQANDQLICGRAVRVRLAEPKQQKPTHNNENYSIAGRGGW